MEELVKQMGFESIEESHKLNASVDLSDPNKMLRSTLALSFLVIYQYLYLYIFQQNHYIHKNHQFHTYKNMGEI
jgi:hypothetical protein